MSSLLFVFGTMVEFALVLIDKQKNDWKQSTKTENIDTETEIELIHSQDKEIIQKCAGKVAPSETSDFRETGRNEMEKRCNILQRFMCFKEMPRSSKLDGVAFVIFNVCYIFFIIIYFLSNVLM